MKHVLQLSLPTFAELVQMVTRQGFQDALKEDGTLVLGELVISSSSDVPQGARLAAGIAERTHHEEDPTFVYRDEKTLVRRRCNAEGVLLEVSNEDSFASGEVMIPRNALTSVAAELIDCLGRKE